MTSSIGFHNKTNFFESNSFEDDDLFENVEEDDEHFTNQGYMYEVPYTSSSVDRSSIGSIPWADDAVKINKLEWEKVEKMLSGLEAIRDTEDDLAKEILDWQSKFPQLLNKNQHKTNNLRSNTLDIESLPSFELTSYDEDYETEANISLRDSNTVTHSRKKSIEEESNKLCRLMDNFTLKSVPFKLNQRETNRTYLNKRKSTSYNTSYTFRCPPSPDQVPAASTNSTNRFRMPPILNVLDSRRKFRSLAQNKNPSFVQLTQIQQAKSAATVTQEQKSRSRFLTGHRSAWHVPFVANRFSNNRNSIILPSIDQTPTTSSTNSDIDTLNVTPSLNITRVNLLRGFAHNLPAKHQVMLGGSTTNASTQTNTSNSTSGRSISAAVKYPRVTTYNALYLPYSASKFHDFH